MVLPLILAVVLAAAAAGAVAGIAIAVARITYTLLMDWFQSNRHRVRQQPSLQQITVDVTGAISSGNAKVIHTGLFDPVREEFVESTLYESSSIDPKVAKAHRDDKVVIWQ
jgi:phosphotransferase system  glucose/maltose/N-acetylglucosamine-specific IIC component